MTATVTDATYRRLGVRLEDNTDHVTVALEGERPPVLILFRYTSISSLHSTYRARWLRDPATLPTDQVQSIATAVGMFLLDKHRGAEH